MDLMDDKGYAPQVEMPAGAPPNESICLCMIISEGYNKKYEKEFDKNVAKKKQELESIGMTYDVPSKNVLELGMSYMVKVLAYVDGPELRWIDGILPTEHAYLPQPTPIQMYSGKYNGLHYRILGTKDFDKQGKVNFTFFYPSTMEEKDWDSGITASKIPEGREDEFAQLLNKETKRKEYWEKLVNLFKLASEDQRIEYLRTVFAKRYGIANRQSPGLYITPEIGMRFYAKIQYWNNSTAFNLLGTDYVKGADGKKRIEYYSDFDVTEATAEDIQFAKDYKDYVIMQEAKQELDEEPPF